MGIYIFLDPVGVIFCIKKKKSPCHPKKLVVEEGDLEDRKRKYRKRKGQREQEDGKLVH